MDHTCHRCGATLEEGVPFCPQCGAPQIRVSGVGAPEPSPGLEPPSFPPGTPGEVQPPAQPVVLAETVPVLNWSYGVPAAALAGFVMAVPSAIPILGIGCCLWIFGGGVLAVYFYQRRAGAVPVTRGMGIRLGLMAGFLGFFLFAVIKILWIVIGHEGGTVRSALRRGMEQAAAQNPDPNAQQVLQSLMSPAGMALMATIFVATAFVAFLLFAMAGGALGASLWGSKQPPRR